VPSATIQALSVGAPFRGERLMERAKHWGCASVATCAEAKALVGTFRFRVVLAEENLPDAPAYELISGVAAAGASLFVAVDQAEGELWLPVVLHGRPLPGRQGMHPDALVETVESILEVRAAAAASGHAPAADVKPAEPHRGSSRHNES